MTNPTPQYADLCERLRADLDRLQSGASVIRPHPAKPNTPVPAAYVASFVDREVALASLSMAEAATALQSLQSEIEGLRGALEHVGKFVEDYFAPWGSWKTAWWEGEVSDDAAFSDNNALKHVANIAGAALSPDKAGGGNG